MDVVFEFFWDNITLGFEGNGVILVVILALAVVALYIWCRRPRRA